MWARPSPAAPSVIAAAADQHLDGAQKTTLSVNIRNARSQACVPDMDASWKLGSVSLDVEGLFCMPN